MAIGDGNGHASNGVNLANWRTSPHSRWAFHHVAELIASMPVANDPRGVAALEPAAERLDAGVLSKLFLQVTATDAIVVLVGGRIAFEFYANGNGERTPHILMSATKAVVGLIAGVLEHAGQLDTGAPVAQYVPEIANTAYRGATVRQLLDMRTGVILDQAQQDANARAAGWNPPVPGDPGIGLHGFLANLNAPGAPHGGPFSYVSANTDLLGWVLERATGRPFAALLSECLWRPMGAEVPASITVDAEGSPRCTGGLCATARDVARLGQLFIDHGRRGRAQVVPEAVIADITGGGDRDAWKNGEWGKAFAPISKTMSYRSGWYVADDDPKNLFAMGIHGQNLFVDARNNLVIAKFSSWAQPTDYAALPLTHWAVGQIRGMVTRR